MTSLTTKMGNILQWKPDRSVLSKGQAGETEIATIITNIFANTRYMGVASKCHKPY
jgi:hypothetical protein